MSPDNALQVLIIDDKADNANRLKGAMEQRCRDLGVPVQTQIAVTAEEFLARIADIKEDSAGFTADVPTGPDDPRAATGEKSRKPRVFIFCDCHLGTKWQVEGRILTGFDMLERIYDELPWAKTVMYSAQSNQEDLRRALRCGAYDLVTTDTLEDTSRGLLRVLAAFAALQQRIEQADAALAAESSGATQNDPLAHLLLKAPVALLVVGRHGSVWFQNEKNVVLAGCYAREGDLCHVRFHRWHSLRRGCPWCPTLESARTGNARQGALLLPVRDGTEIACIEMTSEPLWPLGERLLEECAGAIECSFSRTSDWVAKAPIQRILDLLVSIAGVLAFPEPAPVQVNLYEISRSGLKCRGVAACAVTKPVDGDPTIEYDVTLYVDPDSPGWNEKPAAPGPAAQCQSIRELNSRAAPLSFPLKDHPAGMAGQREGFARPGQLPHSFAWQSAEDAPLGSVQWRYELLDGPDTPDSLLLELGGPAVHRCLEHRQPAAGGECGCKCDIEVYLSELRKAVNSLRDARMEHRGRRVPELPSFDQCRTRNDVWQRVDEAIRGLGAGLAIADGDIWWHYRDYCESPTPRGTRSYGLWLPDDVVMRSKDEGCALVSPYAKHLTSDCRRVELPPPAEWTHEQLQLERDPEALEGCRHGNHPEKSGSWLCRVSGKRILKHCPPSRAPENNFVRVLAEAKRVGDDEAIHKLEAIRSFADFPIGAHSAPVGTFHVQSTDDDLFIPAVVAFLEQLVQGIERALLQVRAHELEVVAQQQLREEVLKHYISSELLEISYLLGQAAASARNTAWHATLESLQRKTHDVAVQQSILLGPAARPSVLGDATGASPELANWDFRQLCLEALTRENEEAAARGDVKRGQPAAIMSPAMTGPPFPIKARRWIMVRAIESVFRAAVLLWSGESTGKQPRNTVETEFAADQTFTVTVPYRGVAIYEHLKAICDAPCGIGDFREVILDDHRPPWLRPVLLELACARLLTARAVDTRGETGWSAATTPDGIRISCQLRCGEA